jgi:hypothetical protein
MRQRLTGYADDVTHQKLHASGITALASRDRQTAGCVQIVER